MASMAGTAAIETINQATGGGTIRSPAVEFCWAQDAETITALCQRRAEVYRQRWTLLCFPQEPDGFDLGGRLLVARAGSRQGLPCEAEGFRLYHAMPELCRPGAIRAEMSRPFVDAEMLKPAEVALAQTLAFAELDRLGATDLVIVAPPQTARLDRAVARRQGRRLDVHPEVSLGPKADYNGIAMLLCLGRRLGQPEACRTPAEPRRRCS